MPRHQPKENPLTVEEIIHWHNNVPCNCEVCKKVRAYYHITEYWDEQKGWVKYE